MLVVQDPTILHLSATMLALIAMTFCFAGVGMRKPNFIAAAGALLTLFFAICVNNDSDHCPVWLFSAAITGIGSALVSVLPPNLTITRHVS